MKENLFKIELEIIKKSPFSFLLGYYEQALKDGLKRSWRQVTDEQIRTIFIELLNKCEKVENDEEN